MDVLVGGAFFVFGTLIGSFLNVVLLRFESGRSLGGRSQCLSCGETLSAIHLVPLLSFLLLRGRCHFCTGRISFQYPLVEALTGLLFLSVYFLHLSAWGTAWMLSLIPLLVLIAVYDLRHTLIPNAFVYPLIVLALLPSAVEAWVLSSAEPLSFLIGGPLLALPLFALWFFSRGAWMGLGDVKLAAGIGFALGLERGVVALLLSFWSGALVGILLLFIPRVVRFILSSPLFSRGNHFTMKSEIPFAPFLIFGFLAVLLGGLDFAFLEEFFLAYAI
jgi:leader peptidase (prepilin peptidase) / N-methyltransferase